MNYMNFEEITQYQLDIIGLKRVIDSGYLRPTNHWNDAKQEEFRHRKEYTVPTLA